MIQVRLQVLWASLINVIFLSISLFYICCNASFLVVPVLILNLIVGVGGQPGREGAACPGRGRGGQDGGRTSQVLSL